MTVTLKINAKKLVEIKDIIIRNEKVQAGLSDAHVQTQTQAQTQAPIEIIDLFATKYIENIIEALAKLLRETGIEVNVYIRDLTNDDIYKCCNENNRYLFICCPQYFLQIYRGVTYPDNLNLLPENKYFLYQLEKLDIGSPVYLNENIISLVKKSRCTFEYSEVNLLYYPEECKEKVVQLLPPVVEWNADANVSETDISTSISVKKIDVLFCGRNTDQRINICQSLRLEGYNVVHVTDIFGKELTELIKKAKIFLNLHHDQSSSLETCRLNEAVTYPDVHIISEKSDQIELEKMYQDRVHFIERISGDNYVTLVDKVKELLDGDGGLNIGEFNKKKWNERINERIINIKKYVLILCNNTSGGSFKFIKDIINYYSNVLFKICKNKKELNLCKIYNNTIIIIQSFLSTDFDVKYIIDIYTKYKCKIIIPIHDWYWFDKELYFHYNLSIHNIYISNLNITEQVLKLFCICDKIICPSNFVFNKINKLIPNINTLYLQEWLDYDYKSYINDIPSVRTILNRTINIGIFTEYSECKGKESIEYLLNNHKNYNNYNINYLITGYNIDKYDESEFFDYIEKYNIHGLLHLNKWGETYCYSLTKSLMCGLPILYNNIGCFKERVPHIDKYIINISDEDDYYNTKTLQANFYKLLDYIINNNGTYNNILYKCIITSNLLFNNIFDKKYIKNIPRYAVYFPQFHEFEENNLNFYKGFTDIVSLSKLNIINKETPNLKLLELNKTDDYNIITNERLINNQFKLLEKYNIDGFAVYYYWFEINTVTNKHTIMYEAINKLLNSCNYGKKIFYIWANEDWSGNASFGVSDKTIKNTYIDLQDICNNLINDFKHANYLKINNRPVFYIHHPWLIPSDRLNALIILLNEICIANGFSGINIKLNSMNENISVIKNTENIYYDFHPNYKKTRSIKIDKNRQLILDYDKYVKESVNSISNVKTLFFDFDNRARLSCPDKLTNSTICINNTYDNIIQYINKINNHFNNIEYHEESMILINAWNEWGERMHIEPSEENGTYYLELINNKLI